MASELLDTVLLQTDFPDLQLHASGKVRDVYSLGDQQLLFVATDRISAFDYILATGIPHKRFANMLTNFADDPWWCSAPKCSPWSAWCAATFPARPGRNTKLQARFPA